jgi:hypothetical protein
LLTRWPTQSIPPELQDLRTKLKPQAVGVASDQDTSAPKVDLPPPTNAGVITAPTDAKTGEVVEEDEDDKWWKIVGGAPRFGDGTEGVDFSQNLSDRTTWVEQRLQDKFFGGSCFIKCVSH